MRKGPITITPKPISYLPARDCSIASTFLVKGLGKTIHENPKMMHHALASGARFIQDGENVEPLFDEQSRRDFLAGHRVGRFRQRLFFLSRRASRANRFRARREVS